MKFSKSYLDRLKRNCFTYSEDIDFSSDSFLKAFNVLKIGMVHVEASANYNSYLECLMLDLNISCDMTLTCSRSNEPVDYKLENSDQVTYSFLEDCDIKDAYIVESCEIDTYDHIRSLLMCSIPTSIVKDGYQQKDLPKEEHKEDPRLAKLKELLK